MEPLLKSEEMRSADLFTVKKVGISASILMEHAAVAVVKRLEMRFQTLLERTRGIVLAGAGNNGGDAVAAARLLFQKGVRHLVVFLHQKETDLSQDCKQQVSIAKHLGLSFVSKISPDELENSDWIVDGLLGTGLSRPLEKKDSVLIEEVNRFSGKKWIVSIDLPSGLSADTGRALPVAVRASETIALGFYKRGLVTGEAGNYVGNLSLATIQIPREAAGKSTTFLYEAKDASAIPQRSKASHKGNFGHVYVGSGEKEKEGASVLVSLGALRSGAGLVTVIAEETLRHRLPIECMIQPYSEDLLNKVKEGVFVIGPGMGTDDRSWVILKKFLSSKHPLILDADALNLIAEHADDALQLLKKREGQGETIFTPHPKEAARLLKADVATVEADRFQAVEQLVKKFSGTFLLKGHGSLVKGKGTDTIVVGTGDSGLSKGGTGDLLSGIIAGMIAQGLPPLSAVAFSAYCHGLASEIVTQRFGTERATLGTEVAEALRDVFKELEV